MGGGTRQGAAQARRTARSRPGWGTLALATALAVVTAPACSGGDGPRQQTGGAPAGDESEEDVADPTEVMADCLLDRDLDVPRSADGGIDHSGVDPADPDVRLAFDQCEALAQAVVGGVALEDLTVERELALVADVARRPGGTMSSAEPSLVVETTTGSALLAFEAQTLIPRCITSATLRVHTGEEDLPVSAWVSLETDLPRIEDGASLGSFVVATGSPEARSSRVGEHLEWDVTELVSWSRDRQATSDVVVIALKPAWAGGYRPVVFGATEGGRGAVLTVTEPTGCTAPVPQP
jgi:hypothetical protein